MRLQGIINMARAIWLRRTSGLASTCRAALIAMSQGTAPPESCSTVAAVCKLPLPPDGPADGCQEGCVGGKGCLLPTAADGEGRRHMTSTAPLESMTSRGSGLPGFLQPAAALPSLRGAAHPLVQPGVAGHLELAVGCHTRRVADDVGNILCSQAQHT